MTQNDHYPGRDDAPAESSSLDNDWDEPEEDVPVVVLYLIAGLILLAFTIYLTIGGHEQFH